MTPDGASLLASAVGEELWIRVRHATPLARSICVDVHPAASSGATAVSPRQRPAQAHGNAHYLPSPLQEVLQEGQQLLQRAHATAGKPAATNAKAHPAASSNPAARMSANYKQQRGLAIGTVLDAASVASLQALPAKPAAAAHNANHEPAWSLPPGEVHLAAVPAGLGVRVSAAVARARLVSLRVKRLLELGQQRQQQQQQQHTPGTKAGTTPHRTAAPADSINTPVYRPRSAPSAPGTAVQPIASAGAAATGAAGFAQSEVTPTRAQPLQSPIPESALPPRSDRPSVVAAVQGLQPARGSQGARKNLQGAFQPPPRPGPAPVQYQAAKAALQQQPAVLTYTPSDRTLGGHKQRPQSARAAVGGAREAAGEGTAACARPKGAIARPAISYDSPTASSLMRSSPQKHQSRLKRRPREPSLQAAGGAGGQSSKVGGLPESTRKLREHIRMLRAAQKAPTQLSATGLTATVLRALEEEQRRLRRQRQQEQRQQQQQQQQQQQGTKHGTADFPSTAYDHNQAAPVQAIGLSDDVSGAAVIVLAVDDEAAAQRHTQALEAAAAPEAAKQNDQHLTITVTHSAAANALVMAAASSASAPTAAPPPTPAAAPSIHIPPAPVTPPAQAAQPASAPAVAPQAPSLPPINLAYVPTVVPGSACARIEVPGLPVLHKRDPDKPLPPGSLPFDASPMMHVSVAGNMVVAVTPSLELTVPLKMDVNFEVPPPLLAELQHQQAAQAHQ